VKSVTLRSSRLFCLASLILLGSPLLAQVQEPPPVTLQDFHRGHKGFGFAKGQQIQPDNPKAFSTDLDMFFDLRTGLLMNNESLGQFCKGKAGVIDMGAKPLQAVREAPARGYKVFLRMEELLNGHTYCIRTADGKHFAKIHILNVDPNEEILVFTWRYQPKDTAKFDDGK
jgi:hypothetical protein